MWIETFPPATTHSALPVTPHVGVWIETRYFPAVYTVSSVTPHVGVWIETWLSRCLDFRRFVTPHVGVWIETYRINPSSYYNRHTSCRCVDWNLIVRWQICIMLVTPHVGVWIETSLRSSVHFTFGVTPHVGVWIETFPFLGSITSLSHTSCRCVDWNFKMLMTADTNTAVTPHVGVWIET